MKKKMKKAVPMRSVTEMHIALQSVNYEITWLAAAVAYQIVSKKWRVSEFDDNKMEQTFPHAFWNYFLFQKKCHEEFTMWRAIIFILIIFLSSSDKVVELPHTIAFIFLKKKSHISPPYVLSHLCTVIIIIWGEDVVLSLYFDTYMHNNLLLKRDHFLSSE